MFAGLLATLMACANPPEQSDAPTFPNESVLFGKLASEAFETLSTAQLVSYACQGDVEAMQVALKAGANVDETGSDGVTPLFWVFGCENYEGFKALLEAGADPNIPFTGLHRRHPDYRLINATSLNVDVRYLKLLLEMGVDPNGSQGLTIRSPLTNAVTLYMTKDISDHLDLLLKYATNIHDQSAIGQAASFDHWPIVKRMIDMGYDCDLIRLAMSVDHAPTRINYQTLNEEELAAYEFVKAFLIDKGFSFPLNRDDYDVSVKRCEPKAPIR
ncbi:MAG: hypothetical protein AAGK66_04080 [Pseudomonadota bacterium]